MRVATKLARIELDDSSVLVNAMHPGWADTPAVQSSLPRFHRLTRSILRTPAEGADTAVWLAACPAAQKWRGRFFFDREPRRTHLLPFAKESPSSRRALWELCIELSEHKPTER